MAKTITGDELNGHLTFVPRHENFEFDNNKIEPIQNLTDFAKPHGGFYLSVDESWERWCKDAEQVWIKNKARYQATLKPDAKILVIDSNKAIDDTPTIGMTPNLKPIPILDFAKLSQEYDAIFFNLTESPNGELFSTLNTYDCDQLIVMRPEIITSFEQCEPYAIPRPSKREQEITNKTNTEGTKMSKQPWIRTRYDDDIDHIEILSENPEYDSYRFRLRDCQMEGTLNGDGSGSIKDQNNRTILSFDWATGEASIIKPGLPINEHYTPYSQNFNSIGYSPKEMDKALTKWIEQEKQMQELRQETIDCIERQNNPEVLELRNKDGETFAIPQHMIVELLTKPEVNAKFVIEKNTPPVWNPEPDCAIYPVPASTLPDWQTGRLPMRAEFPPELKTSYTNPNAEELTKKCLGPYTSVHTAVAYTKGSENARKLTEMALAPTEERQKLIQDAIQQRTSNPQFGI